MQLTIRDHTQFMALMDALSQYVDNQEEHLELEPDAPAEERDKFAAATAYLHQLTMVLVAEAEQ